MRWWPRRIWIALVVAIAAHSCSGPSPSTASSGISLQDLPAGWSESAELADGVTFADGDFCADHDLGDASRLDGMQTKAAFVKGEGRVLLVSNAMTFPGVDTATTFFEDARTALTSCSGWTDEFNGAFVTNELHINDIGDDVIAFRATQATPKSDNDVAFARKGRHIALILINWMAEPADNSLLERLLRTAIQRV